MTATLSNTNIGEAAGNKPVFYGSQDTKPPEGKNFEGKDYFSQAGENRQQLSVAMREQAGIVNDRLKGLNGQNEGIAVDLGRADSGESYSATVTRTGQLDNLRIKISAGASTGEKPKPVASFYYGGLSPEPGNGGLNNLTGFAFVKEENPEAATMEPDPVATDNLRILDISERLNPSGIRYIAEGPGATDVLLVAKVLDMAAAQIESDHLVAA